MRRVLIACLLVVACARVPGSARAPSVVSADSQPPSETVAVSCLRRTEGTRPARVSLSRQGSAVALARDAHGGLLAYVADADSRSVHSVAVDEGRELARTRVDGAPRQLLVLPDGRVVATLSDGTRIAVLEPAADPAAPMATLCEREVAAEPWGLALSPDDAQLVITSGWGSALTILDGTTLEPRRVVPLAREPRGVLVNDNGVAFVGHLIGAKMSAVDLGKNDEPTVLDLGARKSTSLAQPADLRAERTGTQGYSLASVALPAKNGKVLPQRILLPMVSVDPGDMERRSSVYYGPVFDGVPKEMPMVSAVDPDEQKPLTQYVLGTTDKPFTRECLVPRASAVRAAGPGHSTPTLFVACYGIDAVLELDALAVDPFRAERRRFDVPPGPEGVAIDEATGRAVVFSQMGAALRVLALDDARAAPRTIALDYHPDPALAAAARGRQLFYRTDDTRISGDGVGCSSCHIDGREDGLTWTTPMGPRQTPMLAGRLADTAPYGWEGEQVTLSSYILNTVTRLGGVGIEVQDREDLGRFLLAMKGPPAWRTDDALVRRGATLFDDAAQGCATCHVGGVTDAALHGVSPLARDHAVSFDTPSLRFIGGTAPYFHDGRYTTLEALLDDPASTMGHSATLPEGDRQALAAYLRSL